MVNIEYIVIISSTVYFCNLAQLKVHTFTQLESGTEEYNMRVLGGDVISSASDITLVSH